MKSVVFFICFLLGAVASIDAQLRMNISELIISQVNRGDSLQEIEKIGNDTKTVNIYREHAEDTPHFTAIIEIENISDSLITLFPISSKLEIIFRFEEKLYKQKMNFHIKNKDGSVNYLTEDKYILNSGESLKLDSGGYVIQFGTILEMKTRDINNFSNFLLKILPTLKYQYVDKNGTRIIQNEIYDVKLE